MASYLALDTRCAAMLDSPHKLAPGSHPLRAAHSEPHTRGRALDRAQGRALRTAARWLRTLWQSAAWQDPPEPAIH